ncbi:MAG: hypothetical protein ONB44_00880 [candidate division KSB1 bacterium]|nr:hypothetical protein [candidate division KSB1 bacterium]MDZ7300673.1 hypothetical protein [candidate division KSB1 bacterium]
MESVKKRSILDVPNGWVDLLIRTVITAVVAFVVLQAKEFVDAGMFDTPATAVDAALIAGGIFVVNAILKLAKL